jgi:hypothetical protein
VCPLLQVKLLFSDLELKVQESEALEEVPVGERAVAERSKEGRKVGR